MENIYYLDDETLNIKIDKPFRTGYYYDNSNMTSYQAPSNIKDYYIVINGEILDKILYSLKTVNITKTNEFYLDINISAKWLYENSKYIHSPWPRIELNIIYNDLSQIPNGGGGY